MATRHDRERQQRLNEKHKNVLAVLLSREENKYCADCLAKGPRWASWNLGVLLCIRCSGLHRSLGVHISRVKSVNLDTWTKDQMVNFCSRGNGWAKEYYEANLPKGFKRPQSDSNLEYFIRDKYEKKKYTCPGQVALRSIKDLGLIEETPPDLPQKTRKRDPRTNENIPIVPIAKPTGLKPTSPAIPRPKSLPQLPQHEKIQKVSPLQVQGRTNGPNTDDLLGLSSPPPSQPPVSLSVTAPPSADLTDDLFGPMSSFNGHTSHITNSVSSPDLLNDTSNEQAEPTTSAEPAAADKKMSKDSILSLYSQGTTPTPNPMISSGNFNIQNQNNMAYQQQAPMQGFPNMQNINMQNMQAAYASQQQQQAMAMQQQLQMQQMTQQMANANISAMPNMTGYPMMGPQGPGNPMQNNMGFNMGYPSQGNPQAYAPQQQMYGAVQNGNPGMVHSPAMVQMGGYTPTAMAAGNMAGQQGANVPSWGASHAPGAGVGMNSGHTLSTQLWK